MALKVGELYGVLRLDKTQFDKGIKSSGISFGSFAKTLAFGAAGVAVAIAGIAVAGTKMAIDFERDMANVRTLLGKGSDVDRRIGELSDALKDLSVETGKPLDDLTAGLYDVIGTFGDTADSVMWLETAAKAGAAGMSTTQEALGLLSAVTKSYGDTSGAAAQKASDLAFMTANLGVTTFPQMAASMGKVLPLAASMKISQEELFAVMATLTGVTGNTSEVVTQLSGSMNAVLKPNKAMTEALAELGYTGATAGKDLVADEGLVGAMNLLKDTSVATDKEGLAKMLGSSQALLAVMSLTGAQAKDFEEKLAKMGDVAGATAEAFEIQKETVGSAMDRIGAATSVLFVNVGEKVLPVLADFLDWVLENLPTIEATFDTVFGTISDILGPFLDTLTSIFDMLTSSEEPTFITKMDDGAVVIEEVAGKASILSDALTFLRDDVMPKIQQAWEWWTTNTLPLLQGVFDLVVSIIGDLAGIITDVADVAGPAFGEIFQWITDEVMPKINEALRFFTEDVLPPLKTLISDIADKVGPALGDMFKWLAETALPPLKDMFRILTEEVIPLFRDILDEVIAFVEDNWPTIETVMETVQAALQEALRLVGVALDEFKKLVDTVVTFVQDNWVHVENTFEIVQRAVETALDLVDKAVTGTRDIVDGVVTTITDTWETLEGVFEGVFNAVDGVLYDLEQSFATARNFINGVFTAIKNVWDDLGRVFGGYIDGAVTAVRDGVNTIIRAWNSLDFRIPPGSFKFWDEQRIGEGTIFDTRIPGFKIDWAGSDDFIPNIAEFRAKGDPYFQGGLALLGEQGPELVNLPKGSRIWNAGQTQDKLDGRGGGGDGGSGTTVNQTIYGMMPGDVERETRRALRRQALDWSLEGRR